jgi:hypothetical protein
MKFIFRINASNQISGQLKSSNYINSCTLCIAGSILYAFIMIYFFIYAPILHQFSNRIPIYII